MLFDWVTGCARAACVREAAPSDGIAVSELFPCVGDGIAAVVEQSLKTHQFSVLVELSTN